MIDLIIVLLFVAYALYSGFSSRSKASQDLQQYFLAGNSLRGWQAGVSMAATQFAADTPLLVTGLIATGGIFLVWRLWIYGLAFLAIAFIFGAKWRRSGVITDAEVVSIRYSGKGTTALRVLKAVYYGTVINCTIMAMVLVAAMRISEVFLLWDQWLPEGLYQVLYDVVAGTGLTIGEVLVGVDPVIQTTNNLVSILVILSFTTLYSTTGGLRAVVATDAMQFAFAMVGTLLYAGYILVEAGGFGNIVDRMEAIYGIAGSQKMLSFAPSLGDALLPFLVIIGLQWFFQMNSDGTGYIAQRLIACRSDRQAKIAAVLFTWLQILLRSLIWLVIGVGILVVYPFDLTDMGLPGFAAQREMLFVTGINDLLPPGIKGIMLTGLLGALASTLDTHLNWGASYWSNDIYQDLVCKKIQKREPRSRELVWVARFSNLIILVIAFSIMLNLGSIQQAWFISLLFGAGMGSVLVMRWVWERTNFYSEMSAIAVSLLVAPIILVTTDSEWIRLALMSGISTLVVVVVTLITPGTDHSILDDFYKRIKPIGFWSRTAARVGEPANGPIKKLGTAVYEIIISSVSLFSFLVGIGKLMFRPSSEGLFLPLLLMAIGLALVPLWWKSVISSNAETQLP